MKEFSLSGKEGGKDAGENEKWVGSILTHGVIHTVCGQLHEKMCRSDGYVFRRK
jgi:hypothetical protein